MSDKQLPYRTERLTRNEIRVLRKRMLIVWILGIGIASLTGYFFAQNLDEFAGMKLPLTIFAIFFYGILGFIFFFHTKNAFQKEKKIYSGKITDKKTESSTHARKPTNTENYFIALEGKWFHVEASEFHQVHLGDRVEIYVLGKGHVFNIEKLNLEPETNSKTSAKTTQTNLLTAFPRWNEQITEVDKIILKKHLRKAIFYRTILGFVGTWLLYWIINILAMIVFITYGGSSKSFVFIHYGIWVLMIVVYLLINKRTWLLVKDLRNETKEVLVEEIIDLIQSKHIKPGPNSMVSTRNFSDQLYYYIQTSNHWLQTNEETFRVAEPGSKIIIQRGRYSLVVLNFGF